MTRTLQLPFTVTATDAERAKMMVRSQDLSYMTRLTSDWTFDAITAAGHAAGSLPSNGATLPVAGLVNVAINSPAAIPVGLRGAVTAKANNGAVTDPTFDISAGIGGVNFSGSKDPLQILKASIADNAVCNPIVEGYLDFLALTWIKPVALGNWGCFGLGDQGAVNRIWGCYCNGGGNFKEALSDRIFTGVAAGAWSQIGMHYRYDTGANKIYVRTFVNGAEVNAGSAATAVTATPTSQTASSYTNAKMQIGGNRVDPAFNGTVARASRHFTAISGQTLDPLLLVQQDYAANHLRITGV